jgi:hypothetical protein
VDVQRNRRHFERSPLRFPGPNQLRIEMRIVSVSLPAALFIGLLTDFTERTRPISTKGPT